jgi:hypothetical protein
MWYKLRIPLIAAFVFGVLGFAHFFVPHPVSTDFRLRMTSWVRIISGFGMFIGIYSLFHLHIGRIHRQVKGWGYSIFALAGAVLMMAAGFYNGGRGPFAPMTREGTSFQWLYDYVQLPCMATLFSILAFYIASAAFRTFRARSIEAALLLVAAIVVMFGRVPISEMISQVFPQAAELVMDFPNMAAKRGILLGLTLGAISQSLRVIFGLERSYLGGQQS